MMPPFPPPAEMPETPERSLDALLRRVSAAHAGRDAWRWTAPGVPGKTPLVMQYGQWLPQSAAVAAHLQTTLGIQAGDRVAWLGLNHPAQIVLLFALARLGAMLVPLNHRLAPAEWAGVWADCQPRLLVHDTHFAATAQTLVRQVLTGAEAAAPTLTATELLGVPAPAAEVIATGDAWDTPALLVYTSGTTGRPKAAVHTQGNLLANMAMAAQVQALSPSDSVLTVLPLFHVGGLCIQTLPALSVGATVLLHARFDASATLMAMEAERPTLTLQVPATLKALSEHPRWAHTDLSALRAVWAGSSILPPDPVAAFHARGVPVCNVYGSTETGPFSIALPPRHAMDHVGSCGWPAPGVAVKLCDGDGVAVTPGATGELCIRAANVVSRYWPDTPALDAEGFFHSGDLARQAGDGSFTIVGRAKDMIISGGENIYPAEIENLLLAHALVSECCVVAQPDQRWGEVAVAVVVLKPELQESDADWTATLQAWLDGRLARYKWPRRWLKVESLPKTALGKVKKADLRKLLSV